MAEAAGTAPKLRYEELTERILGAVIEVHKVLGPGLMESAYEECLCHELNLRNLRLNGK
jgi:GxxExxY protein